MEIDGIFRDEALQKSGEDVVVACLRSELGIQTREIVTDAAMKNLLAVAAFDGGFAWRTSGKKKKTDAGNQQPTAGGK